MNFINGASPCSLPEYCIFESNQSSNTQAKNSDLDEWASTSASESIFAYSYGLAVKELRSDSNMQE